MRRVRPTGGTGGVQDRLTSDRLRIYTSCDVVGCEISGAVKNVIAVAAGMADGLGYGMNTKAALITRGLAELARLGTAMGGDPLTFLGLAGAGDLMATCASPLSRNRGVGEQIARGQVLAQLLSGTTTCAEGVSSVSAVLGFGGPSRRHHADLRDRRRRARRRHHPGRRRRPPDGTPRRRRAARPHPPDVTGVHRVAPIPRADSPTSRRCRHRR